jgi:2-polyprenyl-3-methyl-5-hydroxy-6-metoxy-1,4-benzoquinol methylase
MLTVDLDRLLSPGDRVLDVGCGEGRHAHASALEPVEVVGVDLDPGRVRAASRGFDTEVADAARTRPAFLEGDATALPFADGSFDVVVCAEVLEHVPDYRRAIDELERVLAPAGTLALSVPRAWPERICWALSADYHDVEGGHVRIFELPELRRTVETTGLACVGTEYAHAFHTPYWWLKTWWSDRDPPRVLSGYERFLEWAEFDDHPLLDRIEGGLDRLVGKSAVLYFQRP